MDRNRELSIAARRGDAERCSALLVEGADINTQVAIPALDGDPDGQNQWIDEGRTPLMWAITGTNNPALVAELLVRGANINAVNRNGWTAMHLLIFNSGRFLTTAIEVYGILMQHNPNLNLENNHKRKPYEVDNFDSKAIPLAEATKEFFGNINHGKCFEVPLRLIKNENGGCVDDKKSKIEKDWWHRLFIQLIRRGSKPTDLSRHVGGARIHFKKELPKESENKDYIRDYIYVEKAKKVYWVENEKKREEVRFDNFEQFQAELNAISTIAGKDFLALTFEQVDELITKNGGHKIKDPVHRNKVLLQNLKIIYAKISGKLDGPISESAKTAILNKVREDDWACSSGYTTRIATIVRLLFMPESFVEFLYEFRKAILEQLILEYAEGEVHTVARFATIASIGFAIPPNNSADTDAHSKLKDEKIIELELAAFKQTFRFHPLVTKMTLTLKDLLGRIKYDGERKIKDCQLRVVFLKDDSKFKYEDHRDCYILLPEDRQLRYIDKDYQEENGEPDGKNFSTKVWSSFCDKLAKLGDITKNGSITLSAKDCQELSEYLVLRPSDAYNYKDEYLSIKVTLEKILNNGKELSIDELFIINEDSLIQDINWVYVQSLIRRNILQEKIFKKSFQNIAKINGIQFFIQNEEDAVEFFEHTDLNPQQFVEFLQAYLTKYPKTNQNFLNHMLFVLARKGELYKCEYLLALGADPNHLVPVYDKVSPDWVRKYKTYLDSFHFKQYSEGKRIEEDKPAPKKEQPKMEVYKLPKANRQWFDEQSALMATLSHANPVMVELLLRKGAQIKLGNGYGWTALHHLALLSRRFPEVADMILTRLLQAGADVTAKSKDGHRPSDMATDKNFRQRLLQLELNIAIRAGDHAAFADIIHRGAEVNVPNQVLRVLKHNSDKQLIQEAQRQHEKIKQSLEDEIADIDVQSNHVNIELNELVEMNLLARDTVLSSFQLPTTLPLVKKLITALLQGVYRRYPIYSCANVNNEALPSDWMSHVDHIYAQLNIKDDAVITNELFDRMVTCINNEYKLEQKTISVDLFYNADTWSSGEKNEQSQHLTVCCNQDQFYIMAPVAFCYSAREQAAELLKNLQMQGGILNLLILEYIKVQHGVTLTAASVEELAELLQSEREAMAAFSSFVEFLTHINLDQEHHPIAEIALSVLNKLRQFEEQKIFSSQEKANHFEQFRHGYLHALQGIIQKEYIRRREAIDRLREDDPLKQLEKKIYQAEKQLEETNKLLEEKSQAIAGEESKLADLKIKAEKLEQGYKKQLKEVNEKIEQLKVEQDQKEKALQALKSKHDSNSEAVQKAEQDLKDNFALLEKLRAKQKDLQAKLAKVMEELQALQQNESDLSTEKKQLEVEKSFAEQAKKEAEARRKTLEVLFGFVKNVQEIIVANDNIFSKKRNEFRAKLKELRDSGKNQFRVLYDYLIGQPEFITLKSKEVESEAKNAELFFHDCISAIDETLRGAIASFDHEHRTFMFKGFNVSWDECYKSLVDFTKERLESYGLVLNASGHISVPNYVPRVSDLPPELRNLITKRVQAKFRHDKLPTRDNDPIWSELSDQAKAKQLIEGLQLTLQDVMPCIVSTVEVLSGNQIDIESDINLPGIDLTVFANGRICLKSNCKIVTSTSDAPEFVYRKAFNGSDYRQSSDPSYGRPGDHGLCGLAAASAGHIFIRSNREILNLDTLSCSAIGGKGGKGQEGGDGDKGCTGHDTPDGEPGDPPPTGFLGSGTSYMILAEAREPGVGADQRAVPGEISGPGGDGGQAGWGGEGGTKGDIHIEDSHNNVRLIGKESTFEGSGLGANPQGRILSESGKNGDDGDLTSRGGEAGEAAYRGYPRLKIRKSKFLFSWKTETHRNNYDAAAYRNIFRGRYRQSDFGQDYSHKYESTWYTDNLPVASGDHVRKSTDQRSRGENKSHRQNFGKRAENKRNTTDKRTNRTLDQNYKNSLQQQVQKAAELNAVKKSQQRTETETRQLNAEISHLADKLTACNAGIQRKTEQLAQTRQVIENKTAVKNDLDQKLIDVGQKITEAEQQGATMANNLVAAMDAMSAIANEMQKANLASQFAGIDIRAEEAVKQKLTNTRNRLAQAINAAQNDVRQAIAELKAVQTELKELAALQQEEIDRLKEEHRLKMAQQEKLKNDAAKLEKYLNLTMEKTEQKTTATEQVKVTIGIDHETIDNKKSQPIRMQFSDPKKRKTTNKALSIEKMTVAMNELYSQLITAKEATELNPLTLLTQLAETNLKITGHELHLLEKAVLTIKDWWYEGDSKEIKEVAEKCRKLQYYRDILITFADWLQRSPTITSDQLKIIWTALQTISERLSETHPEIQKLINPCLRELCFIAMQKSNEELVMRLNRNSVTEEQIALFKDRISEILFASKNQKNLTIIDEVRYRKMFYQYFLSFKATNSSILRFSVALWPDIYGYADNEKENIRKSLKALQFLCPEVASSDDLDQLFQMICASIIDFKVLRQKAQIEQDDSALDTTRPLTKLVNYPANCYAHFQKLLEWLIQTQPLIGSKADDVHLTKRLYEFLYSEMVELIPCQYLSNWQRNVDSAAQLVTEFIQLNKILLSLSFKDHIGSKSLTSVWTEWFNKLSFSSEQWTNCLFELYKRDQSDDVSMLIDLVNKKINVFELDNAPNSVDRIIDLIRASSAYSKQSTTALIQTLSGQIFGRWNNTIEQVNSAHGDEKISIKVINSVQTVKTILNHLLLLRNENEYLQWLKKVSIIVNELALSSDVNKFTKNMGDLEVDMIKRIKQNLLLIAGLQIDLDSPDFFNTVISKLPDVPEKDLKIFFDNYVFCLQREKDLLAKSINLEKMISVQKNLALQKSRESVALILLTNLNIIDDLLDNVLINSLKLRIRECKSVFDQEAASKQSIESELQKFEIYYRRSQNEEMHIEQGRKEFVRLLLAKMKDQKIQTNEIADVAGLITALNASYLAQMRSTKIFEYKDDEKNVNVPKNKVVKLAELIQKNGKLEEIFEAWLSVLQSAVESIQVDQIEPWVIAFINDSDKFLQKFVFDSIAQQKEISYCSEQLGFAVTNLFANLMAQSKDKNADKMQLCYRFERFTKLLQASAYKTDLFRNVDLLATEYNQNSLQTTRYEVLDKLENVELAQLGLVMSFLRLKGNDQHTRTQLIQDLISTLSLQTMVKDTHSCLKAFQDLLIQRFKQFSPMALTAASKVPDLVNQLNNTMKSNDLGSIRENLSNIVIQLLFSNLSSSDLMPLMVAVAVAKPNHATYNLKPLLDSIAALLARQCLEEILKKCTDDNKLVKWKDAFLQFNGLIENSPREILIALLRLKETLNSTLTDDRVNQILLECTGVGKTLVQSFHGIITKIIASKKIAAGDAKRLAFLCALLPFSPSKAKIVEDNFDLFVSLYQRENAQQWHSMRELESIMVGFINEACVAYIDKKISDPYQSAHIKTLIFNLIQMIAEDKQNKQEALDELFRLHRFLKNWNADATTNNQFLKVIFDQCKHAELLTQCCLTKNEALFAHRLSRDDMEKILFDNYSKDYLPILKQEYWLKRISKPLFESFYEKHVEHEAFAAVMNFKEHLTLFCFSDSPQITEKHYQDLKLLVSGITDADLRMLFIGELNEIYNCKKYLTTSHSIAIADQEESEWLELIDSILSLIHQGGDLTLANRLLHLAAYYPDISELTSLIKNSNVNTVLHKVFYHFLSIAVEKQVSKSSDDKNISLQLFSDQAFTSGLGIRFLEVFGQSLFVGSGKDTRLLSLEAFNNLIEKLMAVKIYQDAELIEDLAQRPLQYWDMVLKRRLLELRLRLDPKNEDHQLLVENIVRLQKRENPELLEKWLLKISDLEQIPYESVCFIFNQFSTKRWEFDEKAFAQIEHLSIEKWQETLTRYFEDLFAKDNEARNVTQLADIMRENKTGVNKSIAPLLLQRSVPNSTRKTCPLEDIITEGRARYAALMESYKNLKPEDIKQQIIKKVKEEFNVKTKKSPGPHYFLRNGNQEQMVEFIATMIAAVKMAEGIDVRDNQLVALVCFMAGFDQKLGRLANISTGEGKTLIARMLLIARCLRSELNDLITSSKALAEPNADEAKPLYEYFGLNVDNICDQQCEKDENERKRRYSENQSFFGEVGSFQRDTLLTENLEKDIRPNPSQCVVVDEADSELIDKTDKVLYISHSIQDLSNLRSAFYFIWQCVHARDMQFYAERNIDAIIKLFAQEKKAGTLKIPSHLQDFVNQRLPIWIKNAYLAKSLTAEREYSLLEQGEYADKAVINDLPTGVEQFQSQWSNGLHQFVQLKHRKALSDESLRAIFISNVSYFNRYRDNGSLNGMTGTLGSKYELELLSEIYGVEFFEVPRFKRERFIHEPDIVVGTEEEKFARILTDVKEQIKNAKAVSDPEQSNARQKVEELELSQKTLADEIKELEKSLEEVNKKIKSIKNSLAEFSRLIPNLAVTDELGKDKPVDIVKNERLKKMQERDAIEVELKKQEAMISETKENLKKKSAQYKKDKEKKENYQAIVSGRTARSIEIVCQDKEAARRLQTYLSQQLSEEIKAKQSKIYLYDSYLNSLNLETEKLQPGDIVIATNIGARGTDLEISEQVVIAGGLYVIGSYLPSNVRIERQILGRGGRKGQPGSGRFIVSDPRANNGFRVSIEQLRDERDELERIRLEEIRQVKVPRLRLEQKLSEEFCKLQKDIKKALEGKNLPAELIALQIKSLQNAWAFWFDTHNDEFETVSKIGEKVFLDLFAVFKTKMLARLDESQDMFIHEPGELMRLAKFHMKEKNYKDAIRCYEKVIDRDPDFCGFAYYYLAQAIICTGSNPDTKQRARNLLKKAIPLFEGAISRLSTANQLIRTVGKQMQESGKGLSPDMFTKTNIDEMGVYQIHIQAAKDAFGSELRPDSFKTGEVVGDEAKIVFNNVRKSLNHKVKNTRLSKKVTIGVDSETKQEEIYYAGQKVEFPPQFAYCKAEVLAILKTKVAKSNYHDRQINPTEFDDFILTADSWLKLFEPHLTQCESISLHEEAEKQVLGDRFWQAAEFCGQGEKLRTTVLALKKRYIKDDFIAHLKSSILDDKIVWDTVYKKLLDQKLIKSETGYKFNEQSVKTIDTYRDQISLVKKADMEKGIDNLPLEKIEEFSQQASHIRNVLKAAMKKNEKVKASDFDKDDFKMSHELFLSLSAFLHRFGLLESNLTNALGLQSVKSYHCRQMEETVIGLRQTDHFAKADLNFGPKGDEPNSILLGQLIASRIIREPSVHFPFVTDSEKQIENTLKEIKETVEKSISELVKGIPKLEKMMVPIPMPAASNSSATTAQQQPLLINPEEIKRREDVERLHKAISEVLEKSIGTLKTIHKVKLDNRNLQAYFEGQGTLPPVVVEFMNSAFAEVLNLVEDKSKGFWDWDAFFCAMLGVLQIVAGVLLTYFCPAAAYFGQVLISEGISDICFAVTSAINGNFSWKAYGDHKLMSLAISLGTAGIGAALSGSATAVQQGINLSATILKELGNAAITVAANVAVNMAMSNISESLIASIFEDFKRDFKKQVLAAASSILSTMKQNLAALYKKVTASDANAIIQRIIQDLNIQRMIENDVSTKAFRAVESITNKLAGFKKANASASPLQTLASIASVASIVMEVEGYRKAIADIIRTPTVLFNEFNAALARRVERFDQQDNVAAMNQAELDKVIDGKVQSLTDNILQQVQAQVQQVFMRAGTRGVNAALAPVIEGAKTWLSNSIDQLYADPKVTEGQKELQARQMAPNPKLEVAPAVAATGEVLSSDKVEGTALDEIMTAEGPQSLGEIKEKTGELKFHLTSKDNRFYLLEPDFSTSPPDFSLFDKDTPLSLQLDSLDLASPVRPMLGHNRFSLFGDNELKFTVPVLAAGHLAIHPSVSTRVKGLETEAAGRTGFERINKYSMKYVEGLPTELKNLFPKGNGFDGVWIKYNADGTLADVIIVESKYSHSGFSKMSKTKTMGYQLSEEWINKNINILKEHADPRLRKLGEIMQVAKEQGVLRAKAHVMDPHGRSRWNPIRIKNLPKHEITMRESPFDFYTGAPKSSVPGAIDTPLPASGPTVPAPEIKPPASSSVAEAAATAEAKVPASGLKAALPAVAKAASHGLMAYGIYSSAKNIVNQYQEDRATGNYQGTGRVVTSEAACWAGGLAGAKYLGAAGSAAFTPIVGAGLALIGGIGGCLGSMYLAEHGYDAAANKLSGKGN